jgi:hypothetical protein
MRSVVDRNVVTRRIPALDWPSARRRVEDLHAHTRLPSRRNARMTVLTNLHYRFGISKAMLTLNNGTHTEIVSTLHEGDPVSISCYTAAGCRGNRYVQNETDESP